MNSGASLVIEKTTPLASAEETAFNEVLHPLGMTVVGKRGAELVLQVVDQELVPKAEFMKALRRALEATPAGEHWKHFNSAAFN